MTAYSKGRLRVLMVSGDSSPLADENSYFARVLRELSEYWRIDVLCPRRKGGKEARVGDVRIFSSIAPKPLYMLNTLHPKLRGKSYDLVVAQDPALYGMLACRIAHKKTTKLIFELHGYYLDDPRWRAASWKNRLLSWLGRRNLGKADFIRIVSKGIADMPSLSKIPESRILYVPSNYVNLEKFKPSKKGMFGKPTVLFVGRLVPGKSLETLLEAFGAVRREADAQLVIVGRGPEEKHLRKRASELGLSESVRFPGFVPNEELPSYYSSAELFAMPSLHEGGPRAVFEAMACGTPPVSTPVGQVPDVVEDGGSGVVLSSFEPGQMAEALSGLLKDQKRRSKMGRAARKRAREKCEWSKLIRNYAKTYIKAVGK